MSVETLVSVTFKGWGIVLVLLLRQIKLFIFPCWAQPLLHREYLHFHSSNHGGCSIHIPLFITYCIQSCRPSRIIVLSVPSLIDVIRYLRWADPSMFLIGVFGGTCQVSCPGWGGSVGPAVTSLLFLQSRHQRHGPHHQ